jgi:hypothetical protein
VGSRSRRQRPPPPSANVSDLIRFIYTQDVPVADAKPEEIKELLGGALFKALYKWMVDSGPVYLLPTGEQGFLRSLQG